MSRPMIALQLEPQWGFAWPDYVEIADTLEGQGWDALWVSDHLLWDADAVGRDCYEAWSLLASLAPVTERIRLGTLVTCNSYRHPSLLAKQVAQIDVISGGRVDFGIGAGWKEEEYLAYGYEFPGIGTRQAQMSEAIDLSRALWAEDRAHFDGRHYRLDAAVAAPKPMQAPLPVWVGGHGDHLLRIVAEKADGWNMVFGRSLEELAGRHAMLDHHCAEVGRDPASVARSIFLYCALVDSDDERDALVAEQAERLGSAAERFVGAGIAAGTIGRPDQIVTGLQAHLDLGFGGLHLLFPYGHEVEHVQRFAAEVLDELTV